MCSVCNELLIIYFKFSSLYKMSAILTNVFVAIFTLIIVAYIYVRYAYSYWQRRGIKSLPAQFPYGNFRKSFLSELSTAETLQELYNQSDEPILGLYGPLRPILLIRDPELIRNVLIRDSDHFHDRGVFNDESVDPLLTNMVHASGAKWRNLRQKLSPTFTTGKLKAMFSTMVDCSIPLQNYIAKNVLANKLIEMRDLSARYATNIIASVAFGIDVDCIADPDAEFRVYGQKAVNTTTKTAIITILSYTAPWIMKLFRIPFFDRTIYEFMKSIVSQNLEYREQQNVVRKDFFQLLVQLRNTGTVQLDEKWETTISNDDKALTLDEITAQVFIFFFAGFETSSSTISYCLYEIAKKPNVQRKVQKEIDEVLDEYAGQLTYNAMNELKYLEACIDGMLNNFIFIQYTLCKIKFIFFPCIRNTTKVSTNTGFASHLHQRL